MLVFTRKIEEGLVIAGEIEIRILSIDRDQVKVGIVAPRHIAVHRREIHDAIQRENLVASKTSDHDATALQQLLNDLRRR